VNLKRLLTLLLIFAIGVGLGIAIIYHPAPAIPPALYNATACFSPNGGVSSNIIKAIDSSKTTIDLGIFDLTSNDIVSSLEKAQKKV